jgi:NitT/TauT family transport system permease protein
MSSNFKKIIYPVIFILLLLVIWEIVVQTFDISQLIFPSPSSIIIVSKLRFADLIEESFNTLYASVLGFIISLIFSTLLSTLFHFSESSRLSLFPIAVSSRAIPIIAIAPIIVLWFGTGAISKIILSSIVSFFPILINQMKGINSFDKDEIELLKTFTTSKWRIFYKVRLPNSLPQLFVGLKVASSFSVIGVIVAEFVGTGSNDGIGYLIKSSSYFNETDLTFSAIFFASIIGYLFYAVIVLIEKKFVYWSHEN